MAHTRYLPITNVFGILEVVHGSKRVMRSAAEGLGMLFDCWDLRCGENDPVLKFAKNAKVSG